MKRNGVYLLILLMFAIMLSGCQKISYPSDVSLELVSKNNMDMFQIETAKSTFDDERANEQVQYPWSTEVKIYYLGNKPLTAFYQYTGEKEGGVFTFSPLENGKPIFIYSSRELIPHDKEQIVLSYGWEINGKLEKGELVYQIFSNNGK